MGYLRRLFEEQLRFRLRDGTDIDDIVRIGNSEFSPVEVLREFGAYEQELHSWTHEDWRRQQSDYRAYQLDFFANYDRYLDLRAAVERQQVVPFVGSGMSVSSGLPTWSEFLVKLGSYASCDSATLKQLIASHSFEEAADLIASTSNPNLFAERVEHDLRVRNSTPIEGPVNFLPLLFGNLVITTNLDNVIERTYRENDKSFANILRGENISNYRGLKGPNERLLLKLHGDSQEREGRVLLSHEYEKAYAKGSRVRDELILIYRQYSLLFLGCSLGEDRTIGVIAEVADTDNFMPRHYALLARPNSDADRIGREKFLTQRGIYPIWYELPHDEAILALLEGLGDWQIS